MNNINVLNSRIYWRTLCGLMEFLILDFEGYSNSKYLLLKKHSDRIRFKFIWIRCNFTLPTSRFALKALMYTGPPTWVSSYSIPIFSHLEVSDLERPFILHNDQDLVSSDEKKMPSINIPKADNYNSNDNLNISILCTPE